MMEIIKTKPIGKLKKTFLFEKVLFFATKYPTK